MSKTIRFNRGYDIPLAGAVDPSARVEIAPTKLCAVIPDDFPGFMPKTAVREGDKVLAGTPLLYDKNQPDLKLVSPAAGVVRAIVRGERRHILRVEIEVEGFDKVHHDVPADADGLLRLLAGSGLGAMIRQRPYDIVPQLGAKVRDIFVTAVSSAPLDMPQERYLGDEARPVLEAGAALLGKLTTGKVYVAHRPGFPYPDIAGTEDVVVEGPHPSGNAGVIASAVAPVNKGETIWTLDVITLYKIGSLALKGEISTSTFVSVVGPEVSKPGIVQSTIGAQIKPIVDGRLLDDGRHKRIISGNVLTGIATGDGDDAFLHYPYRQITVIAEGDDVDEFMGWASLSPTKLSAGRTFPLSFFKRLFRPDARINGGHRAMIMSGEYDKMIPMDIMPEYLVKAILAKDIDRMEQLGIYEVAPEDFALAEFADTSKLPLQQIVRDGLDYVRKENS